MKSVERNVTRPTSFNMSGAVRTLHSITNEARGGLLLERNLSPELSKILSDFDKDIQEIADEWEELNRR